MGHGDGEEQVTQGCIISADPLIIGGQGHKFAVETPFEDDGERVERSVGSRIGIIDVIWTPEREACLPHAHGPGIVVVRKVTDPEAGIRRGNPDLGRGSQRTKEEEQGKKNGQFTGSYQH